MTIPKSDNARRMTDEKTETTGFSISRAIPLKVNKCSGVRPGSASLPTMSLNWVQFAVLYAAATLVAAHGQGEGGNNALFLSDKMADYGGFVKALKANVDTISLRSDYDKVRLTAEGESRYRLVVLMGDKVPPALVKAIVDYLEMGGSLLWAGTSSMEESLLRNFGMRSLGPVRDSFSSGPSADVFRTKNYAENHWISRQLKSPISYNGVGFGLIPAEAGDSHNTLARPLISAEETARAGSSEKAFGDQITLAATIDTRVGGRIFVAGSAEMFTDTAKNEEIIAAVADWAMGRTGVVRVDAFDHIQGRQENADAYVVRTRFNVSLCMSIKSGADWKPFIPSDAQAELILMHPRERISLIPDADGKCLRGEMLVPDVYGRYTLRFEYSRPGINLISRKHMISARPPWLDQLPRIVLAALPYHIGWQSQLAATCLLLLPLLLKKMAIGK